MKVCIKKNIKIGLAFYRQMDNFCFLVSGFLKLCFLKACVNVRNQQTWLAGLLRIATVLSEKKYAASCVYSGARLSVMALP